MSVVTGIEPISVQCSLKMKIFFCIFLTFGMYFLQFNYLLSILFNLVCFLFFLYIFLYTINDVVIFLLRMKRRLSTLEYRFLYFYISLLVFELNITHRHFIQLCFPVGFGSSLENRCLGFAHTISTQGKLKSNIVSTNILKL